MPPLPAMLSYYRWFLLCVIGFDLCGGIGGNAKVTNTLSGKIRGFVQEFDRVKVETYLGIPYAQPPLGKLRFRAPVPVHNWTGIKDAGQQPNSCVQSPDTSFGRFEGVEMWNPSTNLSEDCLYLNLWVPRVPGKTKLPVMLWIFGGSFVYGGITLDVYNGTFLAAKKNVIVASMQYRMGVHGFLYSGTEEAPGNMGLLDQQMAMKWLHDNIKHFGGDESKITLFGESSGSVSISHHMLANSSWPYFNNGIMLSGTSLAPWAWESAPKMLDKFHGLADIMGCDSDSVEQTLQCLRDANVDDLEAQQWGLANKFIGTFIPVIDGNFLRDTPENLIRSGAIKDTDVLLGTTKDEGEFFLMYLFQDIIRPEHLWNPRPLNRSEYEGIVGTIGGLGEGLHTDAILYTYEYSVLPSARGTAMDLLDEILGDYLFKCSVHDWAIGFSNQNPSKGRTYVYSFNYRHSDNPWPGWMGALHGYEIEMVFGLPFNPHLNYNRQDRIVSEQVMEHFTAFAKYGSPNSLAASRRWPEFSAEDEEHLVFEQNGATAARQDYRLKQCAFWGYLSTRLQDTQERLSATSAGPSDAISTLAVCVLTFLSTLHL